jgi:hypothetical protein
MIGGTALALPALGHHEFLALPVNLIVAAIFGSYRRVADEENIWSFSPFVDLSLYRWVRRTSPGRTSTARSFSSSSSSPWRSLREWTLALSTHASSRSTPTAG